MARIASHRIGQPAPLPFHLGAAATAYMHAVMAAPNAAEHGFPWHDDLPAFEGPAPAMVDVGVEAAARLQAMLEGIGKWQTHPFRRPDGEPPTIWQTGSSRVLDYGQVPEASDPAGTVVLVVPSLINRAYVLDLLPRQSFLRRLAAAGLRPLLLDWGPPAREEQRFDLDAYVNQRLTGALGLAHGLGGRPPALLGYCMGGTLSAGFALTRPGQLRALVTIGAPWDFSAAQGATQALRGAARTYGNARLRVWIRTLADAFGSVPVQVFQHLFAMLDPIQAARKFRRFGALPQDSARAACFVALEDWLADGLPMAGPAAEGLLVDWYLENTPARGTWPALPRTVALPPSLVVLGETDNIAQPAMADALARALPAARTLRSPLGHVGMITSGSAPDHVWSPVVEFLRATA